MAIAGGMVGLGGFLVGQVFSKMLIQTDLNVIKAPEQGNPIAGFSVPELRMITYSGANGRGDSITKSILAIHFQLRAGSERNSEGIQRLCTPCLARARF